ncbi:MAG TPA: Cof-type HAD-IIB family hydrolase [Erysipelotrichaceae bacterium]|nr:Cof-type HAD-IIB family hydrolase [Erysipelotrichaceae bacterium]HQB32139.1 Cof-type HAD-IIB family hydrolase [Erysipelotrichaceae bacterium]
MRYYIFVDIDWTLLDNNTNSIPASAAEAISLAKRNGHKIFLCTGRSLPSVTENFLQLDIDGIVAACGGHIIIDGKQEYFCPMPEYLLKAIVEYFINNDVGFMLEGKKENYLYCANDISEKEKEMNEFLFTDGRIVPFINFQGNYQDILKLSFFTLKKEAVDRLMDRLDVQLHALYDDWYPGICTGEITYARYTKASGIDFIISRDNHPLQKVLAIGDSMNDYEMIVHAGIGVAIGNAHPKLKEVADYVTDAVDADGLYNCFKKYGLI